MNSMKDNTRFQGPGGEDADDWSAGDDRAGNPTVRNHAHQEEDSLEVIA